MPMVRVSNGGSKAEVIPYTNVSLSALGNATINLTFTQNYSSAPKVAGNANGDDGIAIVFSNITTSGCKVVLRNYHNAAIVRSGYFVIAET